MPCLPRRNFWLLILCFATCCPVVSGLAVAANNDNSENFEELIDQAKTRFEPISPEQVELARNELAQAAQALEDLLIPGSQRGEAWKRYLRWQGVQESLSEPDKPNLAALNETLGRLNAGADGVQLAEFRRVAEAIDRYVDLAAVARSRDQQKFVSAQLDLLSKYLERYQQAPSTRARFEIERRLDFFTGIGQAKELITALRNHFNHPNIRAEISEQFLNSIAGKPVDDVASVRDCILGTAIRGTGRTVGTVRVETVPNTRRAAVVLHLDGVTYSETKGYKDPVVIRSSGTTPFTATKRIELEDANFWNYPARVNASTSTVTRSVSKQGGGFGAKFVEKIGKKKVAEKKPRANFIAARHAEDRIAENLDEELLPKLQDARYEYENQFKKPFADRNATPRSIAFSSTRDALHFDMLQAGDGELGADNSPPAFPSGHAVTVRVHETGAANVAATILGGATLSQKTKAGKPKLNVELPKKLREAIDTAREEADTEPAEDDSREFKPWSIVFRRLRPVTLQFSDNKVQLRLHAVRISVAEENYDGWDIVVNYGMHVQNGGLTLIRDGDIEVIPTSFDPAEDKGLSSRQVGTRGVLAKELNRQADAGRGFPEEIEIPMIDLPEKIAEHGPLMLENAASEAGWLSLGWVAPE